MDIAPFAIKRWMNAHESRCVHNLAVLSDWVATQPQLRWVRPRAGTTALIGGDSVADSTAFCEALMAECGVLFTPGAALDAEGYIRVGFANHPEALARGLPLVADWPATRAT